MTCKECGENTHRKMYTCCQSCRDIHEADQYSKLPVEEWDGESLVVIYKGDEYFNDAGAVYDYCDEHSIRPEELMLCHCEGIALPQIDINDHFCDAMHEDQDANDIDQNILAAEEALNLAISEASPMCYRQADIAVEYKWESTKE
jgi:hypothetical protein